MKQNKSNITELSLAELYTELKGGEGK